jgi:hypothetical protein
MPSRDLGVPNTRRRILLENRGHNCRNNVDSEYRHVSGKFVLTLPHAEHKDAREQRSCVCPP